MMAFPLFSVGRELVSRRGRQGGGTQGAPLRNDGRLDSKEMALVD